MSMLPNDWNTRPEPDPQAERFEWVCRQITKGNQIAVGALIAGMICWACAVAMELMK